MATEQEINSIAPFKLFDICWLLLGLGTDGTKYLHGIIDVFLTVCFTIPFPVHLVIGLVISETKQDIFESLVICGAVCACSLKVFFYRQKVQGMRKLRVVLRELDKRVQDKDECTYFRKVMLRNANFIVNLLAMLYTATVATTILTFLVGEERHLLFPGWLPVDWRGSTSSFIYAGCYQCFGFLVAYIQALSNDIYPILTLCLLAGHVHLLKMRVSKLGYDASKTKAQHNKELIACIQDYRNLMGAYKTIEDVVSMVIFTQFISGALNIGAVIIYMILYVDNVQSYLSHGLQMFAYLGELFPTCYYGSLVVYEFQELPYAIFSSNWLDQPKGFRKNVIIFMELSLQVMTAYAGGMVRIHVDTIFTTCKMAYSFFALMFTMK